MKCINCENIIFDTKKPCPYCNTMRNMFINMGKDNSFEGSNISNGNIISGDLIQTITNNIYANYPRMSGLFASTIFNVMVMAEILERVNFDVIQFGERTIIFGNGITSLLQLAQTSTKEALTKLQPILEDWTHLIVFFTNRIDKAVKEYNLWLSEYIKTSGPSIIQHQNEIRNARFEAIQFYNQTIDVINSANRAATVVDQVVAPLNAFHVPKIVPASFDEALLDCKRMFIDLRLCFEETEMASRRVANILYSFMN